MRPIAVPVLWHIPVSHYNEKVRWALEHKGVEHERRAPPPPAHMAVAMALTRGRGRTFPLLTLDGAALGDSTEIIAALERSHPQRPLYPRDPGLRHRALELEDFFDEELGPYSRLVVFHELRSDPVALQAFTRTLLPAPVAGNATLNGLFARGASSFAGVRYRIGSEEALGHAKGKIAAAFDRLEAELARAEGEFLVGDAFSVADLTAASLFAPVVQPPEGPVVPPPPAAHAAYMESLRDRPGVRWVQDTFARHRGNARRP